MKLLDFIDRIIDTFTEILGPVFRPMSIKLLFLVGVVALLCWLYMRKRSDESEEENEED